MPRFPALAGLLLLTVLTNALPQSRAFDFSPEAGRPVLRNFRPTDYRGHPQVFSVAFGPQGFVYFGNQEGILEFDGVRWTHHAAPTPLVYHLESGPDGRLWAGGNDEIGCFEPQPGGQWHYVSVLPSLPENLKPTGRTSRLIVHGGATYFATGRGIVRWQNGVVRAWTDQVSRWTDFAEINGELFVHRGLFGLWRWRGEEFELVSQAEELKRDAVMVPLRTEASRSMWAVALAGVFWIDHATGAITRVPGPLDQFVRQVRLQDGQRLRDGTVALSASGKGLLLISPDGTKLRLLDRTSGLADNVIISLGEDRDGGLWLGYNSGAARLDLASPVSVFDAGNGPTPGTADCWGRHDGRMYLGAFDGVYLLEPGDPLHGTGANFKRVSDGVSNVFGLESVDGELLVACGAGLVRLNPDHTTTLLVDSQPNSPFWLIRSRLTPNRYYLGGQRGLTVVEHTAAGWAKVGERLDLGDVHNMVEEPDGTLWLSSYSRGFWRVPLAQTITAWSAAPYEHYRENCGLPENFVWTTVSPGLFGPVFFTDKGAARFDPATKRFQSEDRYIVDGFAGSMLTPSAVDSKGAMWASVFRDSTIAATSPLGKFPRAGNGRIWEPAPAGALQEIGFSGAAVMFIDASKGNEILWARGYDNMIRLDLGRLTGKSQAWNLIIREMKSGTRALPPSTGAPGATLTIPFSREALRFEFAAPHFAALDGLRYQFRLVGYNDDWSDWSPQAFTSFTNLEGGPFRLEVRARDVVGDVSAAATTTFLIEPPWQRSSLAFAGYLLLGLASVVGFVRWRLNRVERERLRLENLVVQRTAELHTAKEQAESASRAKTVFLASMSHELRTPLNGVIGYAQVIMNDRELSAKNRERVHIVQTSGEHLLRMINEVLDFSKIEAGRMELHPAPFHLPQMLRDIAAAISTRAEHKELEFVFALAPDLPEIVVGDAQKLRQVIDNLLSNAIKFTARGEVRLQARPVGDDRIAFSVSDTGVGISDADREKLFQPFQQAADGRPPEPGTGLGLAISQRLVALMDSRLVVESRSGAGSCFSFDVRLPALAVDTTESGRAARTITGYAGARRTLLLVDDVAVNRHVLRDLLQPVGFEILEAASGESALASAAPDLAFIDLRMPGMDGLELVRRLRAREGGDRIKLVAMSASVLSFNRDDAFAAGCDDFLPKPFREAELLEKLGRLLHLEWNYAQEAPAPKRGSATPFAELSSQLDSPTLAELLAFAQRGEILALRERLATLRARGPDSFLDALDAMARSYRMEQIRELLERQLAARPSTA